MNKRQSGEAKKKKKITNTKYQNTSICFEANTLL